MATLNQIAYGIWESVRGNIGADDNIDLRKIKFDIINQRALLIRNELNRNRTINPSIVQSLGCLDVELVSSSACCVGLGNCSLLRTKDKIPDTIERHGADLITRVGGPNIMSPGFSYVDYQTAVVSGNGRFNQDVIFAFLFDGYMYLMQRSATISFTGIEKINIMGVFADPTIVSQFKNCDGTSCFDDDDSAFPIAEWMITYLQTALISQYLGADTIVRTDESLNAKSDVTNGGGQ